MKTYLKRWVLLVFVFLFSFNAFANPFDNTNLSSGDIAYWPQPYIYEKNEMLLVDIKTTPEILRALVPEPLKPNPENIITLYIGRLHIVEPGKVSYLEAALMIPASYEEKTKNEKFGSYLPILYLDKVGPIIGGREVYGFPKQDAEIELTRNDNLVHGIVKRYGEIIIDLKLEIKEKAELTNTESSYSIEAFLFKRIPSVNLKNEYDVRQITSVETNFMINEQFLGNASLKFGSTQVDPLDQIPLLEVVNGRFEINNLTLPEGEVLHDYLQK